jgi:threonine dehydrogenase-like Zn-dependent dehydrogenase
MKAAQYFGIGDVRVVDVSEPSAREHEALVAIEWCGICGSDLHEYIHGRQHSVPARDYLANARQAHYLSLPRTVQTRLLARHYL